jgi:hypothetical protein
LFLNSNSKIDLRDNGQLWIDYSLKPVVDQHIADGLICNGSNPFGLGLRTDMFTDAVHGDFYRIQAIDQMPTPGDANGDGLVDDADATILADNWLTTTGAEWTDGDFNGDGAVNEADASILAGNYGYVAPPAASAPEPSTLLLLFLCLASLTMIRRR